MAQKVNPNGLRYGVNKNWQTRWNSMNNKTAIAWVLEDESIRKVLFKNCFKYGVGPIEIERIHNHSNQICSIVIHLHLAQSLIANDEQHYSQIEDIVKRCVNKKSKINLKIKQLANPHVCARVVANEIITSLEGRLPFRNVIRMSMKNSMMNGAIGIKVRLSGRVNGAEIARSECYSDGMIPLSTLRADIDYHCGVAKTTYGILGVKVWINRGLFFGKHFMPLPKAFKREFTRTHIDFR